MRVENITQKKSRRKEKSGRRAAHVSRRKGTVGEGEEGFPRRLFPSLLLMGEEEEGENSKGRGGGGRRIASPCSFLLTPEGRAGPRSFFLVRNQSLKAESQEGKGGKCSMSDHQHLSSRAEREGGWKKKSFIHLECVRERGGEKGSDVRFLFLKSSSEEKGK